MDTGNAFVPVLAGQEWLDETGAIIDFSTGQAVFTKVDPTTPVQLQKSSGGHLLVDLTKDVVEQLPLETPGLLAKMVYAYNTMTSATPSERAASRPFVAE